ncbi:SCO family protein [Flagellimonas myxillae]|uniref:SCO family protein n=1 Tax=Flagellimonas myxillae TaxID=2942214 RepID=UPI00201F37AA|nr:SCO family protein [Muricauda myxillae]MCL6268239.1 SCO family protein [Muricauda myxillae]
MRSKMKLSRSSQALAVLFLMIALGWGCKETETVKKHSRVDVLPYYDDPSFTPKWVNSKSDSIDGLHRIPKFRLINQLGDTISEKTFDNSIYVADFFFTTCPGICPKMTQNMALIQAEFQGDGEVLLLSHSVTPQLDSVPVLKRYADTKGIKPNKWHLATGERKDIYNLGRFAYFVEEDLGFQKGEDEFLHTENFVLIDKNRHIRGIYNGLNKTAINQLIADIKTLKKEQ